MRSAGYLFTTMKRTDSGIRNRYKGMQASGITPPATSTMRQP
jgi:hypothetical protein